MPSIRVVIPTLNGASVLGDQLEALTQQDFTGVWELIIADNGCTDGTAEVVGRYAARLAAHTVDASSRRGASAARNAGVARFDGDVILFLDDDDVVAPDWLSKMAAAFDSGENDVVAGGLSYDFATQSQRPGIGLDCPFLPYGLGANLGIRRNAFDNLKGFDPTFLIAEDVDLCWRAQLAGFRFAHELDAVVYKRERSGHRAVFRQRFDYGRADVKLFLRFRRHGMRPEWRQAGRRWAWLATRLPHAVAGRHRRHWVGELALALGRTAGSVKNRVMFP